MGGLARHVYDGLAVVGSFLADLQIATRKKEVHYFAVSAAAAKRRLTHLIINQPPAKLASTRNLFFETPRLRFKFVFFPFPDCLEASTRNWPILGTRTAASRAGQTS